MPKGELSWWHACRLTGEKATEKWYLLFEFFSANATPYAVVRVAACDGSCAWEGTFSADELSVLSNSSRNHPKVLESIRRACEIHLMDVCKVRRRENGAPTLAFTLQDGRNFDLKLQIDLTCSAFADRTVLYDSHLHANVEALEQKVNGLEHQVKDIEKDLQIAEKKIFEREQRLVVGVRVLMQQKLDHFK